MTVCSFQYDKDYLLQEKKYFYSVRALPWGKNTKTNKKQIITEEKIYFYKTFKNNFLKNL